MVLLNIRPDLNGVKGLKLENWYFDYPLPLQPNPILVLEFEGNKKIEIETTYEFKHRFDPHISIR